MSLFQSKSLPSCEKYADQSFKLAENALQTMIDANNSVQDTIETTQAQIDTLMERKTRLVARKTRLDDMTNSISAALYADHRCENHAEEAADA